MHKLFTLLVVLALTGLTSPTALAQNGPRSAALTNDGSFSYQGSLKENGLPANGDYYFRFSIFDSVGTWLGALYAETLTPVTVVDGLFNVNIQMGGDTASAQQFWKDYGHLVKYLEIEVTQTQGVNWTMLSPRVELGSAAHSMYARFSDALRFPYTDTYGNTFGDTDTMFSLTHQFGGTVLELNAGQLRSNAILSVLGATPSGTNYGLTTGAVHINAPGRSVGLFSISNKFSIIGLLETSSDIHPAAILGQVNSGVMSADAVRAINNNSGNITFLGTPNYAGEFIGDVIISGKLRVQGEPTRDYAPSIPSPIGPLAYASVNANAAVTASTANISVSWDSVNQRYVVTVAGEFMHNTTHTVSVTVVDTTEPRLATFNSSAGNIVVKIWDLNSGNIPVQDSFSIVIYDAIPALPIQNSNPKGVNPAQYIQNTGGTPSQTRPGYDPYVPRKAVGIKQQD